jgi:hypothetical protein
MNYYKCQLNSRFTWKTALTLVQECYEVPFLSGHWNSLHLTMQQALMFHMLPEFIGCTVWDRCAWLLILLLAFHKLLSN